MKIIIDIPDHIYEHAKNCSEDSYDEWDAMRAIAKGLPYEERPHGEWIEQFDVKTQYYTCTCSVCGDTHRLLINYFLESNFCPNCGADMRKRGDQK